MRRATSTIVAATLIACAAAGCNKQYIAGTEIEDTPENNEVLAFCERYRHAVEDLNVGLLLSMASPRYFDNSGTPSGDDDFDKTGLEEVLRERFKAIKALRYEFKYRDVRVEESRISVEYSYTLSFQYAVGDKSHWENETGDNRLELERIDDGFLVLSGL